MTECARCGDCCTDFPLNTPDRADIWGKSMLSRVGRSKGWHFNAAARKQFAWMANLEVISGPFLARFTAKDGTERAEWRWRYRCPVFDEKTRLCGDHANRPSVCRRFPHYGDEPKAGDYKSLSPRCSFVADDPSVVMLPIVEVSHGRAHDGGEDVRHSAA